MIQILLALRFLLELCLLASAAVIGASTSDRTVMRIAAAAALMAVVAILWGALLAPRRRIDLPVPARALIELAVFLAAGIGLAATGRPGAGLALLVAEVILLPTLAALGHPPGSRDEAHAAS